MKNKIILTCISLVILLVVNAEKKEKVTHFYQLQANSIDGKKINMSDYKGKVILVVNTASKCGLTPQYEGLELLYATYKDKGLVILGFPCNQFLGQEPGSEEDIVKFCTTKYNITFPLFEKILVNGDKTHALYVFLKEQLALENKNDIRWNFEKFLIDKSGKPVKRYSPKTKPAELIPDIELLLK